MLDGIDKCLCDNDWSAYCVADAEDSVEKRAHTKMISILDERPGHKTLNKAVADEPITKVGKSSNVAKACTDMVSFELLGHHRQ